LAHSDYDPKIAKEYEEALPRIYRLADEYVGTIMHEVDDETLIVVTGDHGSTSYHTTFYINNFLAREGFLDFKISKTGIIEIDWKKTKAYASGAVNIYINLKGRDPDGAVHPGEEYERVREDIIRTLYRLQDPLKKINPISMVLKREEAKTLGYYGEGVGDIIYTLKDGYYYTSVVGRKTEKVIKPVKDEGWYYTAVSGFGELKLEGKDYADKLPIFEKTRLFNWHTAEHGCSSPLSSNLSTITILAGSNIKKGVERTVPIRLVDIAPTIAHLTGIPIPRNCEGSVILDALEEFPVV